jgi:two-component system, NarL family, sensor histidine kinase UhpB
MKDQAKSKRELIAEIEALRRKVAELEVEPRRDVEQPVTIFRRFAEAASQGFGMADAQGDIMYANPFLAQLFGQQHPDDVIGKHLSNFYSDDYLEIREREILPALQRGEAWQGEQRLRFPDGQMHPTIHSIFPVLDENGRFFSTAVIITDITELRETEAELRKSYENLRQSEERYDLVVRGVGVGICDWDARTGKVYYSPRFKALFGYDEDELGDTIDAWASRVHPEDLPSILRQQDDFLASSDSTATLEYRFLHKDNSYRWVISHMIVVRAHNGSVVRMVGSHQDVTEQKWAEERLKREQRALYRMVTANDHERKLIIYDLHDGVAQQLMGALLLVRSLSGGKNREAKLNEKTHRQAVAALSRASAELRRVMNWLRTPVLEKFGLVEAIEDFAVQLRSLPKAPNVRYHHDVRFDRLEPMLENSLFRIAQEAMTNACRHSQSDNVQVELIQRGDQVVLEVRDWGIGFDEKAVDGNRFGLEGIRERTRILGGTVNIASGKTQGTTIRVTLPLIEALEELDTQKGSGVVFG